MNNHKEMNVKNLKKGVLYFIKQKRHEPIAAYFEKEESVKYLRFKNISNTPILVSRNSKFYFPHKNSPTRKTSINRNNSTKRNYNKKRYEFKPTPIKNN